MSSSTGNRQTGYSCPQCHQSMANMEMLQTHLQTVHTKQTSTSTNTRGFFSIVKQKIKTVQDDLKPVNEPTKIYAQYFGPSDNYSQIGFVRSCDDYFRKVRRMRIEQLIPLTRQILLTVELLTNVNGNIPRNGNTKERLKYEQHLVPWMEDSISQRCTSCGKPFGLFARKHHCRLDGKTICTQCLQFLSFSHAQWLTELNASSSLQITEVIRLRLNNLLNVTSSMVVNDGTNEEYLRICAPCARFLERFYDKIRFGNMEKDPLFDHYQKLVQTKAECDQIHPTYSIIIESIWDGETNYHLEDAQRLYDQLHKKYDKIDSLSRAVANLSVSDAENDRRYTALCRNIRAYSVQVFQNFSIRTKRIPTKDGFKRICEEREMKLAMNSSQDFRRLERKNSQAIHFFRGEDSMDGDTNAIVLVDLR